MKLREKTLDHWGDGFAARYDAEPDGEWKDNLTRRIAHLDSLPDATFAAIGDYAIRQSIDAHHGFGSHEEWLGWLGAFMPLPAPAVDMTGLIYPCLHYDGHTLPCLALRNPYDIAFKHNKRGNLETVSPAFEDRGAINDKMGNYPHSFWEAKYLQPYYADKLGAPYIQIGWWSEGKAWLLSPFRSGGAAAKLTQDFPAVFLPGNAPGHLRFRVVNWHETDRAAIDGEWSAPHPVTHLHLNEKVYDAFTSMSRIAPDVPIGVAGTDRFEYLDDDSAPHEFESDWTPPPLPAESAAPRVSAEGKAWIVSRAKRYGKSKTTGRFWRELAEKLA